MEFWDEVQAGLENGTLQNKESPWKKGEPELIIKMKNSKITL